MRRQRFGAQTVRYPADFFVARLALIAVAWAWTIFFLMPGGRGPRTVTF